MQLTTYLNNKAARQEASYFITPDVCFYIYKGIAYSESDFEKAFPIDVHTIQFSNAIYKGKNPNERNLF